MRILISIFAIIFLCAQSPLPGFPPGTFQDRAAIDAASAAYQGPGDVKSGWYVWGSCARVFTAAQANTSTSLCDLVAVTGGAAVCTLRGSATGFVDLAASYCAGATPAAACAAASGGSCKVSQLYDQTGNSRHLTQATLATMPALTFSSSPTGTLPVLTGPSASTLLTTSGTFTVAAPITFSAVYRRTAAFTTPGLIFGAANSNIAAATIAGNAQVFGGTAEQNAVAADSAWHSLNGLVSNSAGNCALNVDGSDTASLTCGTTGLVGAAFRTFRSGAGTQMQGDIIEGGMISGTTTATERNNISANQHSSVSGYNF